MWLIFQNVILSFGSLVYIYIYLLFRSLTHKVSLECSPGLISDKLIVRSRDISWSIQLKKKTSAVNANAAAKSHTQKSKPDLSGWAAEGPKKFDSHVGELPLQEMKRYLLFRLLIHKVSVECSPGLISDKLIVRSRDISWSIQLKKKTSAVNANAAAKTHTQKSKPDLSAPSTLLCKENAETKTLQAALEKRSMRSPLLGETKYA